jgi:hypothetical protein
MITMVQVKKSDRAYETYIGDSVYVFLDPHGSVVLYLSNGEVETNPVFMEPSVLQSFEEWVAAVKKEREADLRAAEEKVETVADIEAAMEEHGADSVELAPDGTARRVKGESDGS